MAGIEPRGGKYEKSYKERLIELRAELSRAVSYDIITPDLFQSQMIQILNGVEGIKIKSQKEIERLTQQIGEEQGRMRACNDMGDLIVSIVSAFNTQEVRRQEEEAALAKDNEEKANYAAQVAADEAIAVSDPEPDKPVEKPMTDIPGVRIIPGSSTKPPKK